MRKNIFFLFLSLIVFSSYAQSIDEIRSINLPVLIINTVNNEEPTYEISYSSDSLLYTIKNATKVPAQMVMVLNNDTLYNSGEYVQKESGLTIKIRGNSSALVDKKPYKLKLQKKDDLLMRGNKFIDKDWLLINDEKRKINTLIGLKINELMGMHFKPKGKLVNVFLNGSYRGLYILTESEERNTDCRVNVSKEGYIFESDAYWWNEDVSFRTTINSWYCFGTTFKYPDTEDLTDEQIYFLRNKIDTFEETLLADGDYDQYIDVESWASWLLAHDILGTYDFAGSNIYFALFDTKASSKIFMPNLWDYDTIMHMENKENWVRAHDISYYFKLLFDSKKSSFRKAFIQKWNNSADYVFNGINQYLDSLSTSEVAGTINEAKKADAKRWDYIHSDIYDNISEARNWFSQRQLWLDDQIRILEEKESLTGVSQPNIQTEKYHLIYNLQGQCVGNINNFENLKKGIYIVNGKKCLKVCD